MECLNIAVAIAFLCQVVKLKSLSSQNLLLSKLNIFSFLSFFFSSFFFRYYYRCAILEKDLAKNQEEHSREGRTLRNKMDATVEFLKQEHAVAMNKVMINKTDFLHRK